MIYELCEGDKRVGYRFNNEYGIFDTTLESVGGTELQTDGKVQGTTTNNMYLTKEDEIKNIQEISKAPVTLDIMLKIEGKEGLLKYKLYMFEALKRLYTNYSAFGKRFVFKDIVEFIKNPCLIELFGVRRTGKTVLLLQTAEYLVNNGVDFKDIAYVLLDKYTISSSMLSSICHVLFQLGVKYLFIDEITYVDGDLDFTFMFTSDMVVGKHVMMAGTDSAAFLKPNVGVLFDRVIKLKTTYIPFKEFVELYKGATVLEYIRLGGLLRSHKDYEQCHDWVYSNYSDFGIDYVGTAIIDNLLHSFDKYDFSYDYPLLHDLYARGKEDVVRSIIIKWVQEYPMNLLVPLIKRKFKLKDAGRLLDSLVPNNLGSRDYLGPLKKDIEELFVNQEGIVDTSEYASEKMSWEVRRYLSKIDCIYKVPEFKGDHVIPYMVRIGIGCNVIKFIYDSYDDFLDKYHIDISAKNLANMLFNALMGDMLEEVLRVEISKAGYSAGKYRDDRSEVDIVTDDYLIEVKLSSKILLPQVRWLVSKKVRERYPKKKLMLITTCNEEKILTCSEKEVVAEVIRLRNEKGSSVGKELEADLVNASDEVCEIECVNATSFLLNLKKCEVEELC